MYVKNSIYVLPVGTSLLKSFCKMEFLKVGLMVKAGYIGVFHGYGPVVLQSVHTTGHFQVWCREAPVCLDPHRHME